jgi:hypothetical protein
MTPEQAAALRAPFDAAQIGQLPKLSCRDCAKSSGKVCPKHHRERCRECGAYMSTAHVHLDYVGHAAVTDRLLRVDPEWHWEPMALDPRGLPLTISDKSLTLPEEDVALWIRLTVCGVTRLGFGGGRNIKEAIGDALRNAAMRFGVGLDLWSKEDLQREAPNGDAEQQPSNPGPSTPRPRQASRSAPAPEPTGKPPLTEDEILKRLVATRSVAQVKALVPEITRLPKAQQDHIRPVYAARIKQFEIRGDAGRPDEPGEEAA